MEYIVSIIIPVYRVERYIERCCCSLFGMHLDNVEFLFVNDATPDGSIAVVHHVLQEFPQRMDHVRILNHAQNKGVACARNTGLEAALGKYIAYVDADDWIEPDMFSKMVSLAEKETLDIVGCDWYLEFESSHRYMRQPVHDTAYDCLKSMMAGEMRWFLWAFLVRRDIYVQNGIHFMEGADIGEDMAVLIQCLGSACSYGHISEALYHYIKFNVHSLTAMDAKTQIKLINGNVEVVEKFITGRFHQNMEQELGFLKLNVKFPLLISSDSSCYKVWNNSFSEANRYIWANKKQAFRNKLLQWSVARHCYVVPKIYYYLFTLIYRILYK